MSWKCKLGWHDWQEYGSYFLEGQSDMHLRINYVYDRVCLSCEKFDLRATKKREEQNRFAEQAKNRERMAAEQAKNREKRLQTILSGSPKGLLTTPTSGGELSPTEDGSLSEVTSTKRA